MTVVDKVLGDVGHMGWYQGRLEVDNWPPGVLYTQQGGQDKRCILVDRRPQHSTQTLEVHILELESLGVRKAVPGVLDVEGIPHGDHTLYIH